MSVNTLTTGNVPIPVAPASPSLRSSVSSGVAPGTLAAFADGVGALTSTSLNKVLTDLANAAGFAGGPCIVSGLGPSGTTLNITIAPGLAIGSYLIPVETSIVITVADNATNFLWLRKDATVAATASMTPPTNAAVYLGAVVTVSGAVASIIDSGVLYSRGGHLIRRTADAGRPTDTPPAGLCLYTQTQSGLYLWDGASHYAIGRTGDVANLAFASDSDFTATAAQLAAHVLEITGSITAGRTITWPNLLGAQRIVRNKTTQTVTLMLSGGTGVAIAAGKCATVYIDGTDVIRVSPDV